jgi:hypothetical protein
LGPWTEYLGHQLPARTCVCIKCVRMCMCVVIQAGHAGSRLGDHRLEWRASMSPHHIQPGLGDAGLPAGMAGKPQTGTVHSVAFLAESCGALFLLLLLCLRVPSAAVFTYTAEFFTVLRPKSCFSPAQHSSPIPQMRADRHEHHGRPSTCSTAIPTTTRPPYDS